MPYGIRGGDSLESTAFMEKCVADVMAKGNSKVSAIKICKVQWDKRGKGPRRGVKA